MEMIDPFYQQDHLQLIVQEKRKWQTEVENKKRQLEDDRRALQHLKSKALRERWLLDGAPSTGPEHNEVRLQLEQDEARTRTLEDSISRLEQQLVSLEAEASSQTVALSTVTSGPVTAAEVKGHSDLHQGTDAPGVLLPAPVEVKGQQSPQSKKPREVTDELKRAMYSLEIRVERDRVTGETRVLSSNTVLPVDVSQQGVKVYEDEQKVVHEMNGEDGIHLLSSSEVKELIHKAEETSMMSQTITTATSPPKAAVQEEVVQEEAVQEEAVQERLPSPRVPAEITGLEAKVASELNLDEASAENPVTMVFMGYQSVEDEDQTKKVLGLQGTVKAELVLIHDDKTPPGPEDPPSPACAAPPTIAAPPTPSPSKPPDTVVSDNGETAGEPAAGGGKGGAAAGGGGAAAAAAAAGGGGGEGGEGGGGAVMKKEKQPCKCCSIM